MERSKYDEFRAHIHWIVDHGMASDAMRWLLDSMDDQILDLEDECAYRKQFMAGAYKLNAERDKDERTKAIALFLSEKDLQRTLEENKNHNFRTGRRIGIQRLWE